jgi:hypothetical protein
MQVSHGGAHVDLLAAAVVPAPLGGADAAEVEAQCRQAVPGARRCGRGHDRAVHVAAVAGVRVADDDANLRPGWDRHRGLEGRGRSGGNGDWAFGYHPPSRAIMRDRE